MSQQFADINQYELRPALDLGTAVATEPPLEDESKRFLAPFYLLPALQLAPRIRAIHWQELAEIKLSECRKGTVPGYSVF